MFRNVKMYLHACFAVMIALLTFASGQLDLARADDTEEPAGEQSAAPDDLDYQQARTEYQTDLAMWQRADLDARADLSRLHARRHALEQATTWLKAWRIYQDDLKIWKSDLDRFVSDRSIYDQDVAALDKETEAVDKAEREHASEVEQYTRDVNRFNNLSASQQSRSELLRLQQKRQELDRVDTAFDKVRAMFDRQRDGLDAKREGLVATQQELILRKKQLSQREQKLQSEKPTGIDQLEEQLAAIGRGEQEALRRLDELATQRQQLATRNAELDAWLFALTQRNAAAARPKAKEIAAAAEVYAANGDTRWATDRAYGRFPAGVPKCNLFVYDMLRETGQVEERRIPPLARQWFDPKFEIDGMTVVGNVKGSELARYAAPGDVVGDGYHVGIVSRDDRKIVSASAIENKVVKNDWGFRGPQADAVFTIRRPVDRQRKTSQRQ